MDSDPLVLFANTTAAAVQGVCLGLGLSHLHYHPRARQPHRRRPPPYLQPTVPLAALPTRWPVASAPDAEAYRASCATSAHSGYDAARLQQPMAACVDSRNYNGAWPHRQVCDGDPHLRHTAATRWCFRLAWTHGTAWYLGRVVSVFTGARCPGLHNSQVESQRLAMTRVVCSKALARPTHARRVPVPLTRCKRGQWRPLTWTTPLGRPFRHFAACALAYCALRNIDGVVRAFYPHFLILLWACGPHSWFFAHHSRLT